MKKLFRSMNEGEEWFYARFGKGETFDATARSLHLWDMPALLLYINGLVDGDTITTLLTEMQGNTSRREEEEGMGLISSSPFSHIMLCLMSKTLMNC